jgi:hypothetical protein
MKRSHDPLRRQAHPLDRRPPIELTVERCRQRSRYASDHRLATIIPTIPGRRRRPHTSPVATVDLIPAPAGDAVTFRLHNGRLWLRAALIFTSVWLLISGLFAVMTVWFGISLHASDFVQPAWTRRPRSGGRRDRDRRWRTTQPRLGTRLSGRPGVRGDQLHAGVPAVDGSPVRQRVVRKVTSGWVWLWIRAAGRGATRVSAARPA